MSARKPIARLARSGLEAADDTRLGEAAMDLDAVGRELARHEIGGQPLLEAELRMGMDVASDARELRVTGLDALDDRHDGLSPFACAARAAATAYPACRRGRKRRLIGANLPRHFDNRAGAV